MLGISRETSITECVEALRATGNEHLAKAANWLSSKKGRPPLDVSAQVAEARRMLEAGEAKSDWDAAQKVARTMPGRTKLDSKARKIYEKL